MKKPIKPADCELPQHIWLASRSPRRLELIQTLGIQATVFLAQDEAQAEILEIPLNDEPPLAYVKRVTQLKLHTALQAMQQKGLQAIVLAADTTVALNNTIFGKPHNGDHARTMLGQLSNTTHQVHTAIAVGLPGTNQTLCAVNSSQVTFAKLPPDFIEAYIASGEPLDKAGAYGTQGIAAQYIAHISGSHSGIMGLPLFETGNLLRRIFQTQTNSKPS